MSDEERKPDEWPGEPDPVEMFLAHERRKRKGGVYYEYPDQVLLSLIRALDRLEPSTPKERHVYEGLWQAANSIFMVHQKYYMDEETRAGISKALMKHRSKWKRSGNG